MPELGLDSRGYRNVRSTVLRRVARRIAELGVEVGEYRARVAESAEERARLATMCRIPISRLWRDAEVFARIAHELLPARAAVARAEGRDRVRAWSAGCASGEEPCSLVLAWEVVAARRAPGVMLEVVATDADLGALARAKRGIYTESSASELPAELRARAFGDARAGRVREDLLAGISFAVQDLRVEAPEGVFDLVLCRNVAFTYFDAAGQRAVAERLAAALRPGAFLVVGRGESLPDDLGALRAAGPLVYQRDG